MRRFITTLIGKVISQVAIFAILLPTFTLCLATRASAAAQITSKSSWAVLPFSGPNGKASPFGVAAAQSVYDELSKRAESFRPGIEPIPPQQVARTEETLGLSDPVTDQTSILRLGQELHANRIVTGQIVDTKIESVGGNRQANVLVSIEVKDVASGLDINGASVQAFSTVRAGNTPTDALINEAISIAAGKAIGMIQMQTLPTGTVLNTQTDVALVNQGSRSGFKRGQEVIVTRGRDEVATAHVTDVDFDSSSIKLDRSYKGIAPGDKVSVIFIPQKFLNIGPSGQPRIQHTRNRGNNSGLISAILLLGVAALLLGGGGNNGQGAVTSVIAQSALTGSLPANKVSWGTNGFFKGNGTKIRWQIYRGPSDPIPIGNVDGNNSAVFYDTTAPRPVAYYLFTGGNNTSTCNDLPSETAATGTGVTQGRQFIYRVELVYTFTNPTGGGSSGGTGGGTGTTTGGGTGTTTGGGTTGGLSTGGSGGTTGGGTGTTTGGTGGGTGGGNQTCYAVSTQTTSHGGSTAINAPIQQNPANGATLAISTPFTFQSVVVLDSFVAEYVLQISSDPGFSKKNTITYPPIQSSSTGILSITADPVSIFPGITTPLWWRVGGKNTADSPGPLADPATGKKYVFGPARSFNRPLIPPTGKGVSARGH